MAAPLKIAAGLFATALVAVGAASLTGTVQLPSYRSAPPGGVLAQQAGSGSAASPSPSAEPSASPSPEVTPAPVAAAAPAPAAGPAPGHSKKKKD